MKNWFLQKNDSEQKIIVGLAAFVILVLLYTFLYLPLQKSNKQLQSSIDDIENEITIMRNLEKQLAQLGKINTQAAIMDDTQLMALIEQAAGQQQISLSNIKTQSKNKISVTLTNVAFNTAMRWLDILQTQQHVKVSQLNVEAGKNGLTNITVIISQIVPE
jgi:type II secretory pathway component PulM